jgi:sulfatase maturation enzyme AslB (radical SAM superfamily)
MTFKDKNDVETFFKLNPELSIVQFHGGEPLMQPEHKLFMEVLSEQSNETINKLTLLYNTNGTQYNEKFIETWNKTKEVILHLSIDDIEERFEYQRYPAKWSTVINNIQKLQEKCNSNVKIILYCTVNMYNIFYLTELIRLNNTTFKLPMFFNLLHYNSYLSIKNLPLDVKNQIKNKVETLASDELAYVNKPELNSIIEYMLNTDVSTSEFDKFFEVTTKHDDYREQSFEKVFPEYYQILKK